MIKVLRGLHIIDNDSIADMEYYSITVGADLVRALQARIWSALAKRVAYLLEFFFFFKLFF